MKRLAEKTCLGIGDGLTTRYLPNQDFALSSHPTTDGSNGRLLVGYDLGFLPSMMATPSSCSEVNSNDLAHLLVLFV